MASGQLKNAFNKPTPKEVAGFISAAEKGNQKAVVEFLDKYPASIDVRGEQGRSTLMYAVGYKHKNLVKILLERGADVDAEDCNRRTALLLAATYGNVESARMLLEKGATIDKRDVFGWSPMRMAIQCGFPRMADLLEQWPGIKKQRDIEEKKARELAAELADYSPALKKDISAPQRFKSPRKRM